MKILIDARKLGDGGIGVYLENLIGGLLALRDHSGADIELSLLLEPRRLHALSAAEIGSASSADTVAEMLHGWQESVEFVAEPAAKYSLSEYFGLSNRQRGVLSSADIYHSPHYTLPYRLGVPAVVTVHDVIHLSRPETFYHAPVARALIRSAVARAAHVITVSSTSLTRLMRTIGYTLTPMSVVPNALRHGIGLLPRAEVDSTLARFGREREYCLFVGDDRRHKNLPGLVEAWRLVRDRLGESGRELELVIVSNRISAETRDLIARRNLSEAVCILPDLSARELCALYNGAQAVVIPSLEEGFGLVALEGLACGVPVVCSSDTSLKEVCESCAWYAESSSSRALADTIQYALTHPVMCREKVKEGLLRAQVFSRESVARMTFDVYEDVLRNREEVSEGPFLDLARTDSPRPFPFQAAEALPAEHAAAQLRRTL